MFAVRFFCVDLVFYLILRSELKIIVNRILLFFDSAIPSS